VSTTASGEGRRWFGKRRSAPEPTPVDITERLSILDLRDPARTGTGVVPGASGSSDSEASDEQGPASWAWKPTIYVPPGPEAAVEAATPAPSEPATPAPEHEAPPSQARSTHLGDAARYEAEAFELPSAGSAASTAETETWSQQVAPAPVAEATAYVDHTDGEPTHPAPPPAPRPDHLEAANAEPTYLEPTPHEAVAAAPVELHPDPAESAAPSGGRDDEAAPPATTTEPSSEPESVEVPVARYEGQHMAMAEPVVDLRAPAVALPEQSSDLTEAAPEAVLASVVEPARERPADDSLPGEDDDVIRWTW
jgi:hypothetical protein